MKPRIILSAYFLLAVLVGAPSSAKLSSKSLTETLLSTDKFEKLRPSDRKKYLQGIGQALLKFEKNYGVQKFSSLPSLWSEYAFADAQTHCMIGAKIFARIGGSCPTSKSPCTPEGGGNANAHFECGAFYGKECIPRDPITDLSERCQKGLDLTDLTGEKYSALIDELNRTFDTDPGVCSEEEFNRTNSGCNLLAQDFKNLNDKYVQLQTAATDDSVSPLPGASSCGTGGINPGCPNPVVLKNSSFSGIDFKSSLCGDQALEFETADGFKRRIFKNKDGKICQKISKDYSSDSDLEGAAQGIGALGKLKTSCNTVDKCIRQASRQLRKNIEKFAKRNTKSMIARGFCRGWGASGNLGCPSNSALKSCKPLILTRKGENPCESARIRTSGLSSSENPDTFLSQLAAKVDQAKGGPSNSCSTAIQKCLQDTKNIDQVAAGGVAERTLCGGKWKLAAGKVAVGPFSAENAKIKDKNGKVIAKITVNNDFKGVTIASKKWSDPSIRIPGDSENFAIQGWTKREGGVQTGSVIAPKNLPCSGAPACNGGETNSIDLAAQFIGIRNGTSSCLVERTSSQQRRSGTPTTR